MSWWQSTTGLCPGTPCGKSSRATGPPSPHWGLYSPGSTIHGSLVILYKYPATPPQKIFGWLGLYSLINFWQNFNNNSPSWHSWIRSWKDDSPYCTNHPSTDVTVSYRRHIQALPEAVGFTGADACIEGHNMQLELRGSQDLEQTPGCTWFFFTLWRSMVEGLRDILQKHTETKGF